MLFVCVLLPACISVGIQSRRINRSYESLFQELLVYGKWVLAINLLVMMIVKYALRMDGVEQSAFTSFSFSIKYSVIAIVLAIVLPYVLEIWNKYVSITFTVGEDNEKEK
jgi:hypothetical protein